MNWQARRTKKLHNALETSLEQLRSTTDEITRNVKDKWQEQLYWRRSDEDSTCLRAFRNSNYEEHKARNPDRVPGTCRWFLKNQKFHVWLLNECSDLLWVTADPGCGKSVLSKSLVESELQSDASLQPVFSSSRMTVMSRGVSRMLCARSYIKSSCRSQDY